MLLDCPVMFTCTRVHICSMFAVVLEVLWSSVGWIPKHRVKEQRHLCSLMVKENDFTERLV